MVRRPGSRGCRLDEAAADQERELVRGTRSPTESPVGQAARGAQSAQRAAPAEDVQVRTGKQDPVRPRGGEFQEDVESVSRGAVSAYQGQSAESEPEEFEPTKPAELQSTSKLLPAYLRPAAATATAADHLLVIE